MSSCVVVEDLDLALIDMVPYGDRQFLQHPLQFPDLNVGVRVEVIFHPPEPRHALGECRLSFVHGLYLIMLCSQPGHALDEALAVIIRASAPSTAPDLMPRRSH